MFTKATVLAILASVVSASPLENRNTDPLGSYSTCNSCTKPTGKPFYLACTPYGTDAAYGAGFVQQVADGQMFCGSSNGVDPPNQSCESATKPFFFFGSNGLLFDNHGRVVESSSSGQLQANYGGGSQGFGLCADSTSALTFNKVNTLYACQNGGTSSYRLYTGTQTPTSANANCNVIHLTASYL